MSLDAGVIADFKAGFAMADIARKHGVSQRTIWRICDAAGLPRRVDNSTYIRWTDHNVAALHRMVHEGRSDAAIAAILGTTKQSVKSKRQGLGLVRSRGAAVPTPAPDVRAPVLRHRDLTARTFGDPPIGRSALDRRNHREAAE